MRREMSRSVIGVLLLLVIVFYMLAPIDLGGAIVEAKSIKSEKIVNVKKCHVSEKAAKSSVLHESMTEDDFRKKKKSQPFGVATYGLAEYELKETVADTGLLKAGLTGTALELYEAIESVKLDAENNGVIFQYQADDLRTAYESVRAIYAEAMFAYAYDHLEELYWNRANGIGIRADGSSTNEGFCINCYYQVSPYYNVDLENQAKAKVSSAVSYVKNYTSLYDKYFYINQWVMDNCVYDRSALDIPLDAEQSYYAHTAMGLLIKGTGVCETYAKTYKIICQRLGIPCIVVISDTHAFDYVKIGGNWYLVDPTWNDSNDNLYFMVSNNPYLDMDHTPKDILTYPETSTSDYSLLSQEITLVKTGTENPLTTEKISDGRQLQLEVLGAKTPVIFTSADESIATVSKDGLVTGLKPGVTTISCYATESEEYERSSVATFTVDVRTAATSSVSLSNTSTGIKISWKAVEGATGYYVYRGSDLVEKITSGATLTCTDTYSKLTNGTKYTYKVRAYSEQGLSKEYTKKDIYRLTRVSISSITNYASKKMKVNYSRNTKANGYQIQYATNSSMTSAKAVAVSTNTTLTKTIGSLTKGKTYYVRIRAYKIVNGNKYYSAWSAKKTVKITY